MKKYLSIFLFLVAFQGFSQKKDNDVWILRQVRMGAKLLVLDNKNSEFRISIKEKKFSGYVGCNRFDGKLEFTKGDQIRPIRLVSTKMACPDLDSLEYATLEAINLSDRLVLKNSKAEFYNQTRLMLRLEKMP